MNKELNILGQNMRVFYKIFVTLLLLALVPQSVFSLDGSGQSGNPYIIKSIDDLKELRNKIDGNTYIYVKQVADIDVSTATTNNAIVLPLTSAYNIMTGFSFNKSFYGEYDGNGKSLTGWVLPTGKRGSGGNFYMSVFGKIGNKSLPKQTIIKNLTIDGALINIPNNAKDNWCVSFIAGYSENSIIENCHVKNSTVTGNGPVIFGAISSKNFGKIENCSVLNTNFITSKQSQKVGSICGDNSGDIKNCSAYSVSLTASSIIGGIIGSHANGVVENCSFNGKIGSCPSGNLFENIGGLCGRITDGSFINCFAVFSNEGEFTNVGQIGGLIGTVDETTKSLVVKNCYSYPQFKASLYTDADIVVGRDPKREDPSRVFESCYCYEYSYGKEFSSSYTENNEPFSDGYKKKHDIGISSSDFMKSGCFAEVLRDYHNAHLKGENPWREDVELQNDTLPVLKFMVNNAYDVDPFCHPVIFTLSHSESGNVTNLSGKVKYITDDQNSSSWAHGIEVKVGNGDWAKLSDVTNKIEGNTIIFNKDYTYSKSKTTVYRAYTYLKADKTKIAYGKIDTVCVGSSTGPETVEGCDSVKYDGRMFYYPNDNGTYKNKAGEEVIIKLGHNERQELPDKIGECGESTINVNGTLFDKSGYFEINSFTNLTGCTTTSYANVKLYPTYTKDSIKVLGLHENSYTYTPLGGAAPVSIKVGNEYVTTPKLLITDRVQYSNRKGCDSLVLNVKYVIPVKYTSGSDKTWSCEPRVYKGVTYNKDTIVVDTIKTPDSSVPGGYLYEINSYYVKVKIPKKIEKTITSCGEINLTECCGCTPDFDDPDKCFTTTPFEVTDVVKSRVCDCDSIIYVTHYTIGERPTRDTTVVSCGSYTYEYKGKKTVWKKSGDYTVVETGKNFGACDNETVITYHVTIGESTSYKDTTVHGCGMVEYKTLSGKIETFKKSQDFVDEITSNEGCSSKRLVHVYVHNSKDNSPSQPYNGCAPYTFYKLNGDSIILNAGEHLIKDTLKSRDGCGCDSIIKNTKLIIAEPQTLEVKEVSGCNEVLIEGVKYSSDTSFVVKKTLQNNKLICNVQFQPYRVKIATSLVENFHVDTCGTYVLKGEVLTSSTVKEYTISTGTECDNKQIYDVRIIKPIEIDSVVYACDSYEHLFFDGHKELIVDDGVVLVDKLLSKVCLCDSIIRKVTVKISHDSHDTLDPVSHCGPYEYVKKSNGQKMLVTTSQIIYDTLITKYGCESVFETEVNIIPVKTIIENLDACKEYHSEIPVWNYNNNTVDFIEETPNVKKAELIFLKKSDTHPVCYDTTKLYLTVHGVGKITAQPVVECDTFIYSSYDGTNEVITSDTTILDTLKSTTCDCDSIILATNIKINKSLPEAFRDTNYLRECDSVKYRNSKGIDMLFIEDIQFLDTFHMKSTGCDSVVIVDIKVPKSTGSVTFLSACGDTTLYDEFNDNFPHYFGESGVWRQVLSKNENGCDNYNEWHVDITPTPYVTKPVNGCGELTFNNVTYTSENENAKEFKLTLAGNTKCDTIHNYILTVYPKYYRTENIEVCDSFERNDIVYKKSVYFRESLLSVNNCDSIVDVNIIINNAHDTRDFEFACNELRFIDEDYNGGSPIFVHNDTIIIVDKVSDKGCSYKFTKEIQVGHPTYEETEIFERFDTKKGYASYNDLILTSDTILYDTVPSENVCNSVFATKISLLMPEYKINNVYECLNEEFGYALYRDFKLTSDTIVYDTIMSDNLSDVVVANKVHLIKPSIDSVSIFTDTLFGCDSLRFIDADFSAVFEKDTIIYLDKNAENGCAYKLVNLIEIGHHSDSLNYVVECYDSNIGYVSFRNLHLTSDTIIYDTIASDNRCGTVVKNKIHLSIPEFETKSEFLCFDSGNGYADYNGLHLTSDTTIYDTVASDNLCGKIIENRIRLIKPNLDSVYVDTVFGCDKVNYLDVDFNDGLAMTFDHDTTLSISKHTANGCDYSVDLQIQIGHHSDSVAYLTKFFDSKLGYVSYRDLQLFTDTVIYDTIASKNRCGTIVMNNINVMMPIHDTIWVDSCMHVTYNGKVYSDSDTITNYFKTEIGQDSIQHIILNVNKCFPYPVLVNKYNWILVCNDIIFENDKFKHKSNVKYKWYKDDVLVSTSSESYFTEDKELKGCYQVGIILEDGSEYFSDLVCIDEQHGYSITPQPNPVDKLQPVIIKCDFPVEGVEGTSVEVFNMNAEKVYVTTAKSSEIVIPGMNVSGYYLVRLTTVTGKVLAAKYIVK